MKFLLLLIFIFLSEKSESQFQRRQRERVFQKSQQESRKKVNNSKAGAIAAFREKFKELNAEFDSTDYEYALLLNDNAGLFAARSKGESKAKFMKMSSLAAAALENANLTDEQYAGMNLAVGQTAYALGRFVFAEKRFRAAKSYFEKASLQDDMDYLRTTASQGLLYISMGRFKLAEELILKAIDLNREKSAEEDTIITSLQNNYAVLLFNLGRYNEAEKEFENAFASLHSFNQHSSMPYAIVLNNQAMLYQSLGRYEEAVSNLQKAIGIAGRLEASKAKNHLKFYSNLALLYQQMHRYDDAENTYRLLENKYEKGKTEFGNLLNNLAILLFVKGRHDRVEEMLKNSANILKANLGENSPAFAKVISDLGNFYRYKGRYDEASPLLEKALQVREQTLGTSHPLYVQAQEDLAILFWKKKDFTRATSLYQTVMEKSLEFINNYFAPMSEAEKSRYWDILSPRFQRYYNFALEAADTDNKILTALFEYRVATKGLLLKSARKVTESIFASANKQLVQDYAAWISLKEELAALYVYSKEDLQEQNINLDSLETEANLLEKKLSAGSKEFSRFFFAAKINFSDVQSRLNEDEVLVEIIRLRYYDQAFTDSSQYIALVITKNNPIPGLVILPGGPSLETEFAKIYRQGIKAKTPDEKSFTHYFSAIEKELGVKKKIYISPDGIFNQLNLNTLYKPGAGYLISHYDFILLGNPGDMLKQKTSGNNDARKAVLMGYPDYGSDRIPELPGTQMEVDEINKMLNASGYQVNEWVQKEATETNLKQSSRMTILHIATHGYFLEDVNKIYWPIGVHADNAKDNVLLRSGLMLAGATAEDHAAAGLDSINNGIITSYEAMNLDLNGTSLVVLSACETGLGEIKAGEGVYGLQRAFLAAGAKAIVMSLWKVDDAATRLLMNDFYSNWLKSGDRQQAFKQAQLQLMASYPHPYYWGAFVMMED
jgi:CHAT domain-containing protein